MLRKTIQALFVAAFFLIIATPLCLLLLNEQQDISKNEKRRLQQLPEFDFTIASLQSYPADFDVFFNDHYGLRSKLITYNQRFKRDWFNKSQVHTVVRGEGDWLFLNDDKSLSDHIGLVPMNETILEGWSQALMSRQAWLKKRGVDYFFVPVPNKMTIYPEKLPMRIRRHAGTTMLDHLLAYLEQQPFSAYLNLEAVFTSYREMNPEEQIYFKTDSHWNKLGAFIAYQNIMWRLADYQSDITAPLELDDLVAIPKEKRGDVFNMSAIDDQKNEKSVNFQARNKCAGEHKKIHAFTKTEAYQSTRKKKRVPVANGCESKKYTAIVMHDSFGAYVNEFFSESFKRVVFMSSFDFIGMDEFIQSESPDFFIDLRVERKVKRLLKPDPRLIKMTQTEMGIQ